MVFNRVSGITSASLVRHLPDEIEISAIPNKIVLAQCGNTIVVANNINEKLPMYDEKTAYKNGMTYENFMHRAYQKYDTSKNDRHSSAMKNVIDAENGQNWVKHLGSFERQFKGLKNIINKALDKYIANKKLKPKVIQTIATFKPRVDSASTTDDLMLIVHQTLELTDDIKELR